MQQIQRVQATPCPRCHWRLDLCLCQRAPQLSSELHLVILMHEREQSKLTNSGRLLEAALPNSQLRLWQRKQSGPSLLALAKQQGRTPVLLFPLQTASTQAANLAPATDVLARSLSDWLFVILDGTWQQAGKMLRSSPELQAIPRLQLEATADSCYRLRRNQQSGHVSTAETGVLLLQAVGLESSALALEVYFQQFLCHYEAQRSQHPLTGL